MARFNMNTATSARNFSLRQGRRNATSSGNRAVCSGMAGAHLESCMVNLHKSSSFQEKTEEQASFDEMVMNEVLPLVRRCVESTLALSARYGRVHEVVASKHVASYVLRMCVEAFTNSHASILLYSYVYEQRRKASKSTESGLTRAWALLTPSCNLC